jgi:hypothetical protein
METIWLMESAGPALHLSSLWKPENQVAVALFRQELAGNVIT